MFHKNLLPWSESMPSFTLCVWKSYIEFPFFKLFLHSDWYTMILKLSRQGKIIVTTSSNFLKEGEKIIPEIRDPSTYFLEPCAWVYHSGRGWIIVLVGAELHCWKDTDLRYYLPRQSPVSKELVQDRNSLYCYTNISECFNWEHKLLQLGIRSASQC